MSVKRMVPLDDLEPCADWRRAQAVDAIPVAAMREAWVSEDMQVISDHDESDSIAPDKMRRVLIADHPEAK